MSLSTFACAIASLLLATAVTSEQGNARDLSSCSGFEVYNNTGCDAGTRVAETTTPDASACCAACKAQAACRSWEWQRPDANLGASNGRCRMNTNPGTPYSSDGWMCGIAKDVLPNATCLACMDVYFNTSIDGDAYRTAVTNTSAECCAACAAEAERCVSWQWTQLAIGTAASTESGAWTNCALSSGKVGHIRNETRGVISGKLKGALPPPNPPAPEPPLGPGGYIGCFVDLLNGVKRDLPFFLCSNGSDATPISGVDHCAPDPRLPSAAPGATSTEVPSVWAGGNRMSPALCASLCGETCRDLIHCLPPSSLPRGPAHSPPFPILTNQ